MDIRNNHKTYLTKPLNPKVIDEFRRDRYFMDYIYEKNRGNTNLLWAGKPMERHFLTLWAIKNFNFPIHPYFVITFLFLVGISTIYGMIEGPRILDRLSFFFGFVSIVILSPLSVKKVKHNTAYAVTEEGVYFKFYKRNGADYHFIDFNDIRSFRVENENQYNPKVIIYPLIPMDFVTKDFISGETNNFPTIEKQMYADQLVEFLSELRVNRRMLLLQRKSKN